MKRSLTFASLVALSMVLLMSGCVAANKMALVKGQATVDVSKESVGLLFIRLSNQYKPGCQPKMFSMSFAQNVFSKGSKITGRLFAVEDSYRSKKDGYNEYLLTLGLEPGSYDSVNFWGKYDFPLLVCGETSLHLKTKVEVKPNAVIYLGHIDAAIRERKSDAEVRAGRLFPLIDQYMLGFSSGTYDVSIQDRFDDDIKLFAEEYPGLQKVKIEKAVIPPSTESVVYPACSCGRCLN